MRPLYFVLKITLQFSMRVYHRRYARINAPKVFRTRRIFTSNHASSFFDPLVIAVRQNPIVHFMTRADIYNGYLKVVFWLAQMIPIYRAQDGADALQKNDEVFNTCYKEIKRGKGLILFAEGFTDEVFIRRLKPIKKGSLRIGFHTCEKLNWSKKVYIQTLGINYTEPSKMRSDVLVSYGEIICLNDYQEQYAQNSARTLIELTKRVENGMKDQITHVENIEWCDFHENIMQLTRKGMNNENYDAKWTLKERWTYSRSLAIWMNEQKADDSALLSLKEKLANYFTDLKQKKIEENQVFEFSEHKIISLTKNYLFLIFGFPLALLGIIHGAPAFFWVKPFVEKSFKRHVFWSSVKMVLGLFVLGVYNIIFLFLFHSFICPSWLVIFGYYFVVIPVVFVIAHNWMKNNKAIKARKQVRNRTVELAELVEKRTELIQEINRIIPV